VVVEAFHWSSSSPAMVTVAFLSTGADLSNFTSASAGLIATRVSKALFFPAPSLDRRRRACSASASATEKLVAFPRCCGGLVNSRLAPALSRVRSGVAPCRTSSTHRHTYSSHHSICITTASAAITAGFLKVVVSKAREHTCSGMRRALRASDTTLGLFGSLLKSFGC
jgi:hypothetical protein